VVVEMESDGEATLRFGDGVHGLRPADGTAFEARYRVGNGTAGNVGADTLTWLAQAFAGIEGVRNPLAAVGGADPESMEEVRQFAPQAFRWQERAVTTGDWVDVSQRQPTVQRAAAQFRWTGSWHTVFVAVDREGGLPVDEDAGFRTRFRAALDRYRLAGYDLEVRAPIFVPLDLRLDVCVRAGYFRSDVKRDLIERFDAKVHRDGSRGFFHPDHFTFGQPVFLSRVYEAAMQLSGVASVRVVRFKRYGKPAATELADGFVPMSSREVARLDNDPSLPENGRLEIAVEGGQ
jgi:predicted phage baseplate assembly protein